MFPDRLNAALEEQARACASLGSPFTARLLRVLPGLLTPGTPLAERLMAWEGDLGPRGHSLPLRLVGALHALVLAGLDDGLSSAYPPDVRDPGPAVAAALTTHAAFIDRFLDSPPQTNEVARSAVLIAAAHWLDDRLGLPLRVSELGASAGLNLNFDLYALEAGGQRWGPAATTVVLRPQMRGGLPPLAAPKVIDRAGVDRSPIDLSDPARLLRLRAYVWPDQADRLDRLTAAAGLGPPLPERADAGDWLAGRLSGGKAALDLVYNTIAWQYFPPATASACTAALLAHRGPLAHLQMESDGRQPGAAVTLRLWPKDETWHLGRADFHGRWLDWTPRRLS